MKKILRDAWLQDLRSGEFQQTIGTLESMDGAYCCLGVLCRSAERVLGVKPATYYDSARLDGASLQSQAQELRDEICRGVNQTRHVKHDGQKFDYQDIDGHLAYLNDTMGLSFSQIADFVEQNVPEDAE